MIRADATPTMGAGHIMRCIALAQAWKRSKGDVIFVSAASLPLTLERIRREGFELELLQAAPGSAEDASLTKTIVESCEGKWVAIDGYHFGADYLHAVETSGSKILLIDDEGRPCAVADVILNQGLHATAAMYPARDHKSRLLLGTRFVMLRKEFIDKGPGNARQIPEIPAKILVTFGGGKHQDVLNEALKAVAVLGPNVEVAVVGYEPSQSRQLDCSAHLKFLGTLLDMPSLMTWADIAVSAAGSTCWELCRFGVPSILIDVASNQRPLGRELHSRGIALHLPGENADAAHLLQALRELFGDASRRREMSEKGMQLIDGKGSLRVVAELRARGIRLRAANDEDARLLWNWANDATVRAASFSSERISWAEHCDWMARKLSDERSQIWMAEEDGYPLGTVRAHRTIEHCADLGITIAPELRGQGLAPFVIRIAVERAIESWSVSEFHAFIKPHNLSSRKAFESAGFQFDGETIVHGHQAVRYVYCHPLAGDVDYAHALARAQ